MSLETAIKKLYEEVAWKEAELAKLNNRIKVVKDDIVKLKERAEHLQKILTETKD